MSNPEGITMDMHGNLSYPKRSLRRHPADVTADRLIDQIMQWNEKFDGYEKDAVGLVINVLREIAGGER